MRASLKTDFFTPPRPRVIAHRGASGDFPENTLAAFRAVEASGASYIELDVHLTRDREVVVIHDGDLHRVAGMKGVIAEMDLAAIRMADAGRNFTLDGVNHPFRAAGLGVPTLREVLNAFPALRFVIEIKPETSAIVGPLLETVEQCAMTRRVLIASEHQAPLDEVRTLAPALPTNFSAREVGDFMRSLASGANPDASSGDALEIPPEYRSRPLVTPASVAAAHRHGVEVHVWTVNELPEMRVLLAMGVDGIITDFPQRLLELVSST